MATENIKIYEEKKGTPAWLWLLPILLLLGLLGWYLTRSRPQAANTAAPATTATATATGSPDLGSVHFDTDKADLTTEGQATLTRAAQYLKQNPAAHLQIEGYTDSTGTSPHNANLSQQRALAAGHYLEGLGIDKSRLKGGGKSDSNPIDSNATGAGKADNRRVEISAIN